MGMSCTERTFTFSCSGEALLAILAEPEASGQTGVLIVVGGPQYRVGSHRQFVLLSRALADAGFPVLRFDSRGMGDSTGVFGGFEQIDEDIAAAIDVFFENCPQVERIVVWGLCDAASASLLYWDATHDERVCGLVLLNPWVRSEATLAKTHIKHYYGQRLLQADFWRKMLTGKLGFSSSLKGFISSVLNARQQGKKVVDGKKLPFQEKMARGLERFSGPALFVLSGNDFTAKEFLGALKTEPLWNAIQQRSHVEMVHVDDADHTFSSAVWRNAVATSVTDWLRRRFN